MVCSLQLPFLGNAAMQAYLFHGQLFQLHALLYAVINYTSTFINGNALIFRKEYM